MLATRKRVMSLYVDRSSQRWVVRDHDGNYWLLPHRENPWEYREAFQPTEDVELEPVPGHYKCMLGLPE
jgi:hypothetical protein